MRFATLTNEMLDEAGANWAQDSGWGAFGAHREIVLRNFSYAALDGDKVLGVGGVVPVWPGRGLAWLLFTVAATARHRTKIVRHIRAELDARRDDPEFARVEYYIRADAPWRESHAAAVGFTEPPVLLRRFGPDGVDQYLYARVAA
jgi:hypothetical protein